MEDKRKILYNQLSKDYELGDFDSFSSKLDDENKRKAFYDAVSKDYDLGDYDSFVSKISNPSPNSLSTGGVGTQEEADSIFDANMRRFQEGKPIERVSVGKNDITQGSYQYKPEVQKRILENKPDMFKSKTVDMYGAHDKDKDVADLMNEGRLYEMQDARQRYLQRPITTFGESFEQGSEALYQGGKNLVGEVFNLATGSQRDYERARSQLDELVQSGYDLSNFDPKKALKDYKDRDFQRRYNEWQKEISTRKEERENMGFFESLLHRINDPSRPKSQYEETGNLADEVQLARSYTAIQDALQKTNGNVDEAYKLLGQESSKETWGDKISREARSELAKQRPTEGFAAWAGGMVPQMIGTGAGIAASLSPYTRWLSPWLGRANMALLTGSTSGMSMAEARDYGASEGDIWKTGIIDAAIEYGTEKLPFERYFGKIQNATKSVIGKSIANATVDNDAAQNELSDLLQRVGKEFGAGLFSKKNISEYLKDVGTEGVSEFMAEALQTISPMVYQNPEDYPTLMEILESGWEGAKGGLFMGAFLGAGSKYSANRIHNQRRKSQGNVTFADTNIGVVEILDEKDGVTSVLDANGEVHDISSDEVRDRATISYNDFVNGSYQKEASDIEDAYESGTELETPYDKHNAKLAVDRAEVALGVTSENSDEQQFAQMVMAGADSPVESINAMAEQGYSDEQIQKAKDYYTAYHRMNGLTDALLDNVDSQIESANREVDANTWNGVNTNETKIVPFSLDDGRSGYVIGGDIVLDIDGKVDTESSDPLVKVRFSDGLETGVGSGDIRRHGRIGAITTPESLKEYNNTELKRKLIDKGIGEIDWNPATPNPKVGDSFEMDGIPVTIVSHDSKGGMFVVPTEEYQNALGSEQKMQQLVAKAQQTQPIPFKVYKDWASAQLDAQEEAAPSNEREEPKQRGTVSTPVALAYLLEGGQNSIENLGYFLHGVAAAFPELENEIETIRGNIGERLGVSPDRFEEVAPREKAEMRQVIESKYGKEGASIFDELVANSTGYVPKVGAKMALRLEELKPIGQETLVQPEAAQEGAVEVNPVAETTESVSNEEVQQPQQQAPVIPTKEDGSIDFVAYGKDNTFKTLGEKYGEKMPNKVAVTAKAFADDLRKAQQKLNKAELDYDDAPIGREDKAEKALNKAREEFEAVKREADFWAEMDADVKKAQEQRESIVNPQIEAETSNEPMTADEFVAQQLANGNIVLSKEDYMRETGFGNKEANDMNGGANKLLTSNGMTLSEAGDRLMEMDRENGTNFFDQTDSNAGRDSLISVLGSVKSRKDLNQYIAENRKSQAKRDSEGARSELESMIMNAYHMTLEEYATLEETILQNNPYEGVDLAQIDAIFAESELERQQLNKEQYESGTITEGNQGQSELLPEERIDNSTGNQPSQAVWKTEGTGRNIEVEGRTSQESSSGNEVVSQIEQARAEVDANPTEAQKEAGNYKKGHVKIDGYDITIENPKGGVRSGTDKNGKKWSITMNNDYGYIRGTEAVDGDHIDVFLSDNPTEGNVFVVDQSNEDGSFDESKVMYGFNSLEEARAAYLSNYKKGWESRIMAITEVSKDEFKKWIDSSHRKTKAFSEYKSVKAEAGQGYSIEASNVSRMEDIEARITEIENERIEIEGELENLGNSNPLASAELISQLDQLDREQSELEAEYSGLRSMNDESNAILEEEGSNLRFRGQQAKEEKRRKPLRERAKEWSKKLGVKVKIMESLKDVTNASARRAIIMGETVTGWYEESTGEVCLYMPYLSSESEVDATYIHEVVAHKGLRGLLGDKFDEFCDEVWNMMSASDKAKFIKYPGVNGNPRAAADEYIAHLAENIDVTESAWGKFAELIKKFLKAIGLEPKMTNADIANTIKRSYQRLAESGNAENVGGEGTRFRFSKTPQEFDAIQKEAVEKKGIVMPGLNEAVVDVLSIDKHDFNGNLKQAREAAKQWAIENYQGKEFSLPDNGGSYTIGKKAINKYVDKTSIDKSGNAMIHLSALKELPNIISSSITGEIHADYKKGENGQRSADNGVGDKGLLIHRMFGAIELDGKVYRVKTTMNEYRDPMANNTPHSYEVTEIELIESSSTPSLKDDSKPVNVSNNSITAANLLNGVEKSYDKGKKLLSESEKTLFRTVYHGSAASFDKFDHSFMSTGEGNQSYGWGTYLTDVESIGKQYANMYAKNSPLAANALRWIEENGTYDDFLAQGEGKRRNWAIRHAKDYLKELKKEGASEDVIKAYEQDLVDAENALSEESYNRTKENMIASLNRNLYTVDIPDNDGTNYLEWDKPLSEENKKRIKDAVLNSQMYKDYAAKYGDDVSLERLNSWLNAFDAGRVYRLLENFADNEDGTESAKQISMLLSDAGYIGFEYPSNFMSGGNENGSKNYVIFNEDDLNIVEHTRFRAVSDKKLIDKLESEPKMKVYRAMQVIDGKLYPPMSAKVDGKLREPIELGKWEEAEERPDLADSKGYFKLDKGNKTSLKARYNPYIHTSTTPLNDQFSSAQDRPELVTVEVEIPESELTSGYKAEKAKDAVGKLEWKAGVVQGKLSGTRTVILSRWDKPIRIVPDSEVADEIVRMFGDKRIIMPSNVVTPSLRAELEKRGVPFVETDNQGNEIGGTRFRTAYHGSAASFDKFDHSFMGTGEGAQAYGWGTYVTEVGGIARSYATTMASKSGVDPLSYVGEYENYVGKDVVNIAKEYIRRNSFDLKKAKEEVEHDLKLTMPALSRKGAEFLLSTTEEDWTYNPNRHLYEVEIPDDNGRNYLYWEKQYTRDELEDIASRSKGSVSVDDIDPKGVTKDGSTIKGGKIVRAMSEARGPRMPMAKEASRKLSLCGFVGIEFPAEYRTGGREDNAKNYVIFNEDDLKIVEHTRFRVVNDKNGKKTLVGLHNISESKLRKAIKQGGLANPSVAVIDMDKQSHTEYGDITFVIPSSMIDKKTGKNVGTYLADAYTPVYPTVIKKMSDKGAKALTKALESVNEIFRSKVRTFFNSYLDSGTIYDALSYWYLSDTGKNPPILEAALPDGYTREEVKNVKAVNPEATIFAELSEEERRKVIDLYIEREGGKEKYENDLANRVEGWKKSIEDENALQMRKKFSQDKLNELEEYGYEYGKIANYYSYAIRLANASSKPSEIETFRNAYDEVVKNGLEEDFGNWLMAKEEELGVEEKLFAGYDNQGRAKYLPNTLENASKLMKKEGRAGATGLGGFNYFVAILAPVAKTTKDINKKKHNLSTQEEYDKFVEEWKDYYHDLARQLQPGAGKWDDYGYHRLHEIAPMANPKSYVKKEYGIELSDKFIKDLNDVKNAIRNDFPARYFETKFERPVYLNEFAAAVVPQGVSEEIVNALSDAGLPVEYYEKDNNEARMEAVDKVSSEIDGIRFRIANQNQVQDEVDKFTSKYKSAPVNVLDSTTTDEQVSEWLGVKDATTEELIDWMEDKKVPAVHVRTNNNIIIFAEKIKAEKVKETLFHENLHTLLNDGAHKELVDKFYKAAKDDARFGKWKKMSDKEQYDDYERPEEFFVYVVSNGQVSDNLEDVFEYLTSKEQNELKELLNINGYDYDNRRFNEDFREENKRGSERENIESDLRGRGVESQEKGQGRNQEQAERIKNLFDKVADMGLDGVLGNEAYNSTMIKMYGALPEEVRKEVMADAVSNYSGDYVPAMHDYLIKAKANIVDKVLGAIRSALRKAGFDVDINSSDVKYLLWRSKKPLDNRNVFDVAEDISKQNEFGVNGTRFSIKNFDPSDKRDALIKEYDAYLKTGKFNFIEAFQDRMYSVKVLMDKIVNATGKKVRDYEDAYTAENQLGSINKPMQEKYLDKFYKPLLEEIKKLSDKYGSEVVERYIYCKSGLERNEVLRQRDADEAYNDAKAELDEKLAKNEINQAQYNALIAQIDAQRQKTLSEDVDYSGIRGMLYNVKAQQINDDYESGKIDKATRDQQLAKLEANRKNEVRDWKNFAEKQVAALEAKASTKELDALWSKINAATNETLRMDYESGMIDKETHDAEKNMMKYYVPLRNWYDTTAEEMYEYRSELVRPVSSNQKRAKGRESQADNPIATIGLMAQNAIVRGNRNKVKQKFYAFVANRETSLATVRDVWYVKDAQGNWVAEYADTSSAKNSAEFEAIIDQFEEDMKLREEQGMAFKGKLPMGMKFKASGRQKQAHVVPVMINGKEYAVYVNGNPRAAQAMNGETNSEAAKNSFFGIWDRLNRIYSAGLTSWNPDFIIPNMIRDGIHASTMTFIDAGPIAAAKFALNGPRAFAQVYAMITGQGRGLVDPKYQTYFEEFVSNGGETGYTAIRTLEDYKKEYDKLINKAKGIKASNWAKDGFSAIGGLIETANRIFEDVNRFNAYVSARESGESIMRSVNAAKNITVNFNRKGAGFANNSVWGTVAGWMSRHTLFFNPAVQGIEQLITKSKANPKRATATVATILSSGFLMPMINELLIAALGGDDEDDYWNQSDYKRRNNWMLYTGDGYVTIPLPPVLRELYGIGDVIYGSITGHITPERAVMDVARQVQSAIGFFNLIPEASQEPDMITYAKGFAPDLIAPPLDVLTNTNFMGRPIAKWTDYNKYDPEYERVYKRTSKQWIEVSKFLNELGGNEGRRSDVWGNFINPAMMEHLITSYGGGIGKTINNLVGMAIDIAEGDTENLDPFRKSPIVPRFYTPVDEKSAVPGINRKYYDYDYRYNVAKKALKNYQEGVASKEHPEYQKYIDEMKENGEIRFMNYFKSMSKQIKDIQNRIKENPKNKKELEEKLIEMKAQVSVKCADILK